MELLIVTGMSGAGKSQAANALEDIGFYCIDNIPPAIIPSIIELSSRNNESFKKIAIITDVRGGDMFNEITDVLNNLKKCKIKFKILFIDASDEVLVRRYKENRRKHPLFDNDSSLIESVREERTRLSKIHSLSDFVIDTSYISSAQLKEKIVAILSGGSTNILKIQCKSFGFKYGVDTDSDLVFDVRCLPNPFYVEELKHKTGLDESVRNYVMENTQSIEFFNKILEFLEVSVPLYIKEGKSQLTIAFGCTGGKHRSVTFAELIGNKLKDKYNCTVVHRDINKI